MFDPHEALQKMLQPAGLPSALFPLTSRYYGIGTKMLETPDGRKVIYLQRRFVPLPERFQLLQEHVVTQGERLDAITGQYLGDSEQFWRLCDANGVMHPLELETLGLHLRITLPEGIPGIPNA